MTAHSINGISQVMQNLGRYYVRYINHTYQRTGTLREGRFKSILVDSQNYLLTLYRYIELNPIRAKMVEHPAAYPYVLGDKQFIEQVTNTLSRRAKPLTQSGDRRSAIFKAAKDK